MTSPAGNDTRLEEGINILIFDGGQTGTTEYSSLRILSEVVLRRADDLGDEECKLKPCEVFDVFCGTGIGGVFAILLGRLQLSVQETITWYLKVFEALFASDAWRNKDIVEALKLFNTALENIPSSVMLDAPLTTKDLKLPKTFITTVHPIHVSTAVLLRSYRVRSNQSQRCTIREALLASIADQVHLPATTFGAPIKIKHCSANLKFNNPTALLLEELPKAYAHCDANVACIVSLGTCHPGILTISPMGPSLEELEGLARDSEQTARMFESRFSGLNGFFFRLSVDQGMHSADTAVDFSLDQQLEALETHTLQYISRIGSRIDKMVDALGRRSGVETCDRLGSLTGPYAKDNMVQEVSMLRQDFKTQIDDKQRQDIREWLSPTYSLEDELEGLYQQGKGSGQWLLNSDKMNSWITGYTRLLVLTGPPGCGKTTISALVDQFLRIDNTRRVFTVINKYSSKMTMTNILERLAVQLLSGTSTPPSALLGLYAERRRGDEKLKETLSTIFNGYQEPIYVILDALDEFVSTTPRKIIDNLLSLSINVHLFVTSRPLPDEVFNLTFCEILRMSSSNAEDLESFIKGEILDFEFRPTATDVAFLERKVVDSSQGIFLLAVFNLQLLSECLETYSARSKADCLPRTSEERYSASMDRIKGKGAEKSETALLALTWVCYAKRELTLEELQHAVACTKHNLSGREIQPALIDPFTLLEICDGLVVVSGGYVGLVHLTARSYFDGAGQDCLSQYLPRLSIGSLRYLNAEHSSDAIQKLWSGYFTEGSFLGYCASYWGDHPHVDFIEDEFDALCANPDVFRSCAITRRNRLINAGYLNAVLGKDISPMPLHIAASFGLTKWMMRLRDISQVNSTDSSWNTPLHYAALLNQSQATQVLLSWPHIKVNSQNEDRKTPLACACSNGHVNIVQALLEKENINVNAPELYGRTPLFKASMKGHFNVVQALLAHEGIYIDGPDMNGDTPLSIASFSGHLDIVQALLEKEDINVNTQDYWGKTPLSRASFNGHFDIVKALMAHKGIVLDNRDINGETALSIASCLGHSQIVQALEARGSSF